MKNTLIKANQFISVYKESEEFIDAIQNNFLNQGKIDIKLLTYYFPDSFFQLDNEIIILYSYWNNVLLRENSSLIINCADSNFNGYQFVGSGSREKMLYYDKIQRRIKLFNRLKNKETGCVDFDWPEGFSIKGWLFDNYIIIALEKFPRTDIYCFDHVLNKLSSYKEFGYYLSDIHCINNEQFIGELYHNGQLKLIYFNDEFKKMFQRYHTRLYITSLKTDGTLFLNQSWSEDIVYSYNGYKDVLSQVRIPMDLRIKKFDRIRFKINGRYAFCLTDKNVLERYSVVQSSKENYNLSHKISLGSVTEFEGHGKNDRHVFYKDHINNMVLKKADTLETILSIPKNPNLGVKINTDNMVIRKSNGNYHDLELINLLNYSKHQVKVPNKQNIRTAFGLEDSLYFSFDEDSLGISKFCFSNGQYHYYDGVSRVRQFADSGHNTLLAASWSGLFEFSENLVLVRQFHVPQYVERGYEVCTYKNYNSEFVIYAGYAKARGGDNFLLIFNYKTEEVLFEYVDKGASNGYSYPVKISESGILYYPALLDGKKYLMALNINTFQNTNFKVEMQFDYREMIVYENNFLIGTSLNVIDNKTIIDLINLNSENGKTRNQIIVDCSAAIIDISLAKDQIIMSFINSCFRVYKLSGSDLVFDYEIKSNAWFNNSSLTIFPDILLLNENQNMIFYNLKTRQIVCKLYVLGESIFLITNDKWLYTNNENYLAVSSENKDGLKEFLPITNEDRKRYLKTYNSLHKVMETLNPRFFFEKMKAEYLKTINEEKAKITKMLE